MKTLFALALVLSGCGNLPLPKESSSTEEETMRDRYAFLGAVNQGWKALPVVLTLDRAFDDLQAAAVGRAAATWNQAVGKDVFAIADSRVDFPSVTDLWLLTDDTTTGIYFSPELSALGSTFATDAVNPAFPVEKQWQRVWPIERADVVLGGTFALVDAMNPCAEPMDGRQPVDLESVVLHELGHVLGLGHIRPLDDQNSVMFGQLETKMGWTARTLSTGDVSRVRWLYDLGPEPARLAVQAGRGTVLLDTSYEPREPVAIGECQDVDG